MAFSPAPSRRPRWQRFWNSERLAPWRFYGRYFRWPLLLVLTALAVDKLLFYGGLPLAGCVRQEWDYAQAQRDFAAGRDPAALVAIRRALLETRGKARFWRLAARISDRLDSPEAAYCWLQTDRLEPGSIDTQLALVEAALKQGHVELAGEAWQEISPAAQTGLRYARDAGQLAQAEGEPERTRYWFAQTEADRPHDAQTLFVLAGWHGGLADAADQERARALFLGLAARLGERLAAWRALVALDLRRHDVAAARTDVAALIAAPGSTFADRVAQLDVAGSDAAVKAQLATLLRTSSPADAAQALDWMTAHGRAEAALIWIRRQASAWQNDPAIGAARARGLAALGDWKHLLDDQRARVWAGHESARLMWLARASFALGNESDARAAWHGAVAACVTAGDFTELEQAADSFHSPDGGDEEKAEVWTALANRFPDQEWPLRALLAYQLGRGDLVAAQALAERLAARAPGDPALGANFDLICLLRDGGGAQAVADLQRLEQRAPDNPDVATAAAYSLYLQGRFDDALATLGALAPARLHAPERAAILGELLAAGGPIDRAQDALNVARAQRNLLEARRAGIERALDLVAYRRALADWRHGADAATRARARDFFTVHASSEEAVFLIGDSVVLADDPGQVSQAALALARIQPADLNPAELLLDEGAVLNLAGQKEAAAPLLELAPGAPVEMAAARWHRAVEAWWTLIDRSPFDASLAAGLLTAYRGLEMEEGGRDFWRRDEAREMTLTRSALHHGVLAGAVQERLEALLRHVPATPELEAEIGYALFLQGRLEAARERLAVLSPAELARPEPARDDAAILRACDQMKRAALDARKGAAMTVSLPAGNGPHFPLNPMAK